MSKMYRRAYIGGTFDCLHRGHLNLFAAAHQIAKEIVVSVNTDEFTTRYKRTPLMPLADRMAVLAMCRLVDEVVVNVGDEDSRIAIVSANVDCIVHGDDWPVHSLMPQMGLDAEWLDANGIAMVLVPYSRFVSTTQLLERYTARKDEASIVDPNMTVCATCGRAVYKTDVDADGNCIEHAQPVGHEPEESNK